MVECGIKGTLKVFGAPAEEQVLSRPYFVRDGYFDDVDVKKALAAERSMRDYIKAKFGDLIQRIEDSKDLAKDDEEKLTAAIKDWKQNGSF